MSVYGYARVSTVRQVDGLSLEAQKRQIEGYAQMRGFEIAHVFVEEGVSAGVPALERPVAGPLLDMVVAGDAIVAPKLDRIFRSAVDALKVVERLKERSVGLHLLDLGGDVCANGVSKLFFTIVAAFAEAERDRISERALQVKADARAQGRWLGGGRGRSPGFGRMLVAAPDRGWLVVDNPEHLALVPRIRRWRRDGWSWAKVSRGLAGYGVRASDDMLQRYFKEQDRRRAVDIAPPHAQIESASHEAFPP